MQKEKTFKNKKEKDFQEIRQNLNMKFFNTENLSFLLDFNLSKDKYLIDIVKCQALVNQLKDFQHFSVFYELNIAKTQSQQKQQKHLNSQQLIQRIQRELKIKKQKIELSVYKVQTKLSQLKNKIVKDIQYLIKLNPRFKQYNYQSNLNVFMTDITKYFHIIIQSIINYTIQSHLQTLLNFLVKCAQNEIHPIQIPQLPKIKFYQNIFVLNYSILCPNESKYACPNQQKYTCPNESQYGCPNEQNNKNKLIFNFPGVQTVQLKVTKLKRKKYINIYKFLIECRRLIRQFDLQQVQFQKKLQKLQINQNQQMFTFQKSSQLFFKIIQNPIHLYLKDIENSQNVFGCVNNSKIKVLVSNSIQFKNIKDKIKELFQKMEKTLVKKYIDFFSLWEVYFSDKIYIQDILLIYRRLNSTNLLKQEIFNLKKDLKLIRKFPNVIQYKFLRIDIKQVKNKIQTTIQSNISKLLKASQENLEKLLNYGYQQTAKVKKLNQVTKYTNIAEYITFITLLNKREAEKSIHKIAENVIIINSNMALLQDNFYDIKFSTIKHYLQCRQWVKDLRKNSIQNQKKISLDPYTFMKGIKQKKQKVYSKYFKIIKDIIQIMKVNELSKFNRYNALAQTIDQQLKQIFNLTKTIGQDQQLLEFKYQQEQTHNCQMNQSKLIKLDFTFFQLQSRFLQNYFQFWAFVAKFRHFLQSEVNNLITNMEASSVIKILRQGQQLIFKIKHSTLNKRFLNLAQQMNKQLQPFLKNIYLMQICITGRSIYRILVLKQITKYLNCQIEEQSITLKQFASFNLTGILDSQYMKTIYRLKEKQKYKFEILKKINSVGQIVKTFEVKTKMLKGAGNTRQMNMITVQYILSIVREFKQKIQFKRCLLQQQSEQQQLLQVQKKLLIFQKSILKMKKCEQSLPIYYSLFQFLYPQIQSLQQFSFSTPYKLIYQQIFLDFYKKSELIIKLSFTTIYNDKVKINYDVPLSQLQQFRARLFHSITSSFLDNINFSNSEIQHILFKNYMKSDNQNIIKLNNQSLKKQSRNQNLLMQNNQNLSYLHLDNYKMQLFQILCNIQNLKNIEINLILNKLFRFCKKINLTLEYDSNQCQLYLNLNQIQSLNQDKITVNHRQKLFQINKFVIQPKQKNQSKQANCTKLTNYEKQGTQQNQKLQQKNQILSLKNQILTQQIQMLTQQQQIFKSYKIEFGLIKSIEFVQKSLRKIHKSQSKQYLYLIYQCHYNVKSLFQIYFSVKGILLQSIITCLNIMFYLDLSLVCQNKYDLNLFERFLSSKITSSYQSKQEQNIIYLQQIKTVIQGFRNLVKYILDRQTEDKNDSNKLKKAILLSFIPRIQIQAFDVNKYKGWLKQIKQSTQDHFLSFTHQIPFLKQAAIPILELGKIDIREVQKKQSIMLSELLQNIYDNRPLNLVVKFPILKNLELNCSLAFGWEPSRQKKELDNFQFYQKQYATSLLIYSHQQQKILIVNEQINTSILGINFIKTQFFSPSLSVNQIIIINSYNNFLKVTKQFLQFKKQRQKNQLQALRNKKKKFFKTLPIIYFLFSDLNLQNINQNSDFEENFIVFHIKNNNIRYLMNEDPSKLELDMITYFSKNSQMAQSLFIYDDCPSSHLIDSQRVKQIKIKREIQSLKNFIWEYYKEKDVSPQVTQFCINCINFPIFFIDSLHQIRTQIYDIFCYIKHLQIQNESLENSIKIKLERQKQSIYLYVLPIDQIQQKQFFGNYQISKSSSYNQQLKQQKQLTAQKKTIRYTKGLLQIIIQSSIQNMQKNDQILSQFMIRGDKNIQTQDKWFIFDFSVNNQHSLQIYKKIITFFKKGFFFSDGSQYNIKQVKEGIKFIFLTNQNIIKFTTKQKTDLFPFPYLKQHNFDPIRYFQINITDQFKYLTKQIRMTLKQWFKKLLKVQLRSISRVYLLQELMCKQIMQMLMTLLNIHLNQIRKLLLSKGYYTQENLTSEQTLQNFYGAVQLRDKTKKQAQSHIEYLQRIKQIEQNLKRQRKTIYNKLNNNQSYQKTLKKSAQNQLTQSLFYLNDISISKNAIQIYVKNYLLFCLYYSIRFNKTIIQNFLSKSKRNFPYNQIQMLLEQIDKYFLKLIGIKHVKNQCFQNYYYNLAANSWNSWHEFNSEELTLDSCTNSVNTLTLHSKQILRLNKSAKMSNIKSYCQFIKKQKKQEPNYLVYKTYMNYFVKMLIIYKVPQVLQLKNQQQFYNWSLYRDLLNLKYNNFTKLKGVTLLYNSQHIFKISNQNKKAQKIIKNTQIKQTFIHFQLFNSVAQPSFIQWCSFINYGFKKYKNQYFKPQNMSFLAIISPLEIISSSKVQLTQDELKQKSIKFKVVLKYQNKNNPDLMNVISSFNPQFLTNSSLFRQNFINILMIIKTFQNRKVFDRIVKIIHSSNSVKIQNVSSPKYHIYRLNGIIMKFKQQNLKQAEISDSNELILNSKNKLTDILNLLMKTNDSLQKQDLYQMKKCLNQLITQYLHELSSNKQSFDQFQKQMKINEDQSYTNYELVYKLKFNFKVLFNAILFELSKKLILQFVSLDNQQQNIPKVIIRYMVSRPKKYISSMEEQKQKKSKKNRIKEMTRKQQYNDILDFNNQILQKNKQQFKQFQVSYLDYSKIFLFFQLRQNILIIKVQGQFTSNLIQKYIQAYKLYQLAKQISHNKSKQKIFSLKDEQNFSRFFNISQLLYQFQDNKQNLSDNKPYELRNPLQDFNNCNQKIKLKKKNIQQNDQSLQQLNYIKIYDAKHIQIVLNKIEWLQNNKYFNQNLINLQRNVYFLIFVPHQGCSNQIIRPFPYCKQRNFVEQISKKIKMTYENYNIQPVYHQMFLNRFNLVKNKLLTKLKTRLRLQIQTIVGKYVYQANIKFTQLRVHAQKTEKIVKKKLVEIQQNTDDISKLKQSQIKLNNDIKQKLNQQRREKEKLQIINKVFQSYIGQTQFKHQNETIRIISKKVLQKQIQNESYSLNEANLLYVLMFNVLADNNFFNQKLQDILNLDTFQKKVASILQSEKKTLSKHVNYGRLAVLIQNEEVLYGNLLTEDQLTILQKLRKKFNFAVQMQKYLKETSQFSDENQMSLNIILLPQLQHIQNLKLSKIQKNINIYILYLFASKYIKRMLQKKRLNLKGNMKRIKDNINSAQEKYQSQNLQLNQLNNYLKQLQQKVQIFKKEEIQCKKNQQIYLNTLKLNIIKITKTLLSFKVGFLIFCDFQAQENQNVFKETQNKLFQRINISPKGDEIIQKLTNFIVFEMTQSYIHKPLTVEQAKLLIFLIDQPFKIYEKEDPKIKLEIFFQFCVCHLMQCMNLKVVRHNLGQNQLQNKIQKLPHKKYCELEQVFHFYVTNQKENLLFIFQTECQMQTELQVPKFLQKLINLDKLMKNKVLLLSQKIQKLNTRSSRLIQNFQIMDAQLIQFLQLIISQIELKPSIQKQTLTLLENHLLYTINLINQNFLFQFDSLQKKARKQMFQQILHEAFMNYNLQKQEIKYFIKLSVFMINQLKIKFKIKQFSKLVFCSIIQKNINFHSINQNFSLLKRTIKQNKSKQFEQNEKIDESWLNQTDILEYILKSNIEVIFIKFQKHLFQLLSQYSKKLNAQLNHCQFFSLSQNQNINKNEWFYYQIDQLTSIDTLKRFVDQIRQRQINCSSSSIKSTSSLKSSFSQKSSASFKCSFCKNSKYIFAICSPSLSKWPNIYNKINPVLYRLSAKSNGQKQNISKQRIKKEYIPNFCYQILFNDNFKINEQQELFSGQNPKSPSAIRKKMSLKTTYNFKFTYETLVYFFFCVQNISISQISYQIILNYFKLQINSSKSQINQFPNQKSAKIEQIKSFKSLLNSTTQIYEQIQQLKEQDKQYDLINNQNQICQYFNYSIQIQDQKYQSKNKNQKSIFQTFLKPKINQQAIQQYSNNILSDPYIYIIINKAFRRVISRIIQKRNSINLPIQSKSLILNQKQSQSISNSVKSLQQIYYELFKFSIQSHSQLSDVFLLLKGSHLTKKIQTSKQNLIFKTLQMVKQKQNGRVIPRIFFCMLKFNQCQHQKELIKIFGINEQKDNSFILQFSFQKCSEYNIKEKKVGLDMRYYAAKQFTKKQKQQLSSPLLNQNKQFVQKNQYITILPIYSKQTSKLIGQFQLCLNQKIQGHPKMYIII